MNFAFVLESVYAMSHTDKSNNHSQDNNNGHPLLEALSQFGRSFFLYRDPYTDNASSSEKLPSNVITIWERLENREVKIASTKAKVSGGLFVKRIAPKEPIDFLEYCRRKN